MFAVEATRAQVCVRSNGSAVTIRVAGREIIAPTTNGVAVVDLEQLHPKTNYVAQLLDSAGESIGQLSFQTRRRFEGDTVKFATISDVHLGGEEFGGHPAYNEPPDTEPHFALRCAAAAVREAIEWGAEVLVIKGDLTDTGARTDWELAHRLLDDLPIPVLSTWGNHDVWKTREVNPAEMEPTFALNPNSSGGSAGQVTSHDLGPTRIILADTSVPDRGHGTIAQHEEQILELIDFDGPVFLGIHHNIMRTPLPWFWPPGIAPSNASSLLAEIIRVNPNVFISSGHTHRNRLHRIGPGGQICFSEVSATADYPGAWAGYEVSDTLLRQTVRRIAAPEALLWTERVRGAIFGVWPRWSQGRLDDRCVDMSVPIAPRSTD